jgi:pantoate--beta-alanine ligase
MEIIKSIQEMKRFSSQARKEGKKIVFVPTMGFFHEGHLSLMREGKKMGDILVVSLFVNPTQFGPSEDFERYPRDFERDRKMSEDVGVDVLFSPERGDVYPPDHQTIVRVEKLTRGLCGRSRPTHFQGVTTVVNILFNIVKPHIAIFGEKDYQQLVTIKQMVKDLHMDVEIVGMPTVREKDGLAMSSRNQYLKPHEREAALAIYRSLKKAEDMIIKGVREIDSLKAEIKEVLSNEPLLKIDYIEICDASTLENIDIISGDVIIAIAVYIGETRLIDNMVFKSL